MRRPFTATYLRRMTITYGSVEYSYLHRCLSLVYRYTGNIAYQENVEINEQLSRRNSLKAICYRPNCVNSLVPESSLFISEVLKLTSSCHEGIH